MRVVYADTSVPLKRTQAHNPKATAALLRPLLAAEVVEVFGVLLLDAQHHPLAWHVVSRGTTDGTMVFPRDVFRAALMANAVGVILAHNHPSGEPKPSVEDISLTRRMREAGAQLQVDVLDHIIIGANDQYISLRERGDL